MGEVKTDFRAWIAAWMTTLRQAPPADSTAEAPVSKFNIIIDVKHDHWVDKILIHFTEVHF